MKLLGKYKNGNVFTAIYNNGTKVRFTLDDEFKSEFAENIDIKITNKCSGTNCSFCHEGSGPNEAHGDILNLKFIESLHPYQEVAIGGGNALEHPDLVPFLEKLKAKNVIANITVHQLHFLKNYKFIKKLIKDELIHGVGVSLIYPTRELIDKIKKIPNCVIHVINGIVTPETMEKLFDNHLKILILGYKRLRRGEEFFQKEEDLLSYNQHYLKNKLSDIIKHKRFAAISFDNLAIEQLNVKDILSNSAYNKFYMGDEGSNTFYIDCVNKQFAKSSTEPIENRFELLDSVDQMFQIIQNN